MESRAGVEVTVFYEHIPDAETQGEGFGAAFTWDLPLLQGYRWKVLNGEARQEREGRKEVEFDGFREAFRGVDVMLVHGWQSGYMYRAWLNGLWAEAPLLVRGESNSLRSRPWYVRGLHRGYLRPFDRYLYIGEGNRQFYRNAGISSEALYFAPYCIENDRFDADWQELKEDRGQLRSEIGIDTSAVCFLFCGKFIEKKRPTDVVEAFEAAQRQLATPAHLLMVGDGELFEKAKRQVINEASVTFTGFLNQTEIGEAYAAADVMVLPSRETWGLVVNEAMIFECPAIVSDRVGCGPDLIQDGETGYTFPFGDVEALTSTMVRLAESPDHIRKMGAQARKRVLSDYTIQRAADGIVRAAKDVYEEHA
ncbi:glycosyltransferase family 4 protein [Salinibacter ruber]|uniref:glycosyltransferase family 4 protein n=1 Tax=Salinibacter ruber TaxID=146919 RepID=UPI0021699F1B|nr:glycosyltransferase involved in cell wall biosynthesis [Salinibacter ruber]